MRKSIWNKYFRMKIKMEMIKVYFKVYQIYPRMSRVIKNEFVGLPWWSSG